MARTDGIKVGERVEIKDHIGNKWKWSKKYGAVTEADSYCLTVHRENGRTERDVREHYRRPR